MKTGIMQPYLFPYIGYFQLINEVELFIFYDDVSFIKQGWINRNKISLNNKANFFTIPLTNGSSNVLIKDVQISPLFPNRQRKKLLKSIEQSYSRSPYFEEVFPVVQRVFNQNTHLISEMAICSVKEVCEYLGISTVFENSSQRLNEYKSTGRERVVDICFDVQASHYINPIGGMDSYSNEYFEKQGIELSFLQNDIKSNEWSLSIIDVLMNYSKLEVINNLRNFSLVKSME
jgi:hypothetical protein